MRLSAIISVLILLATSAIAATQVVFTGPFSQTTVGTASCTWPASNTLDCTTSLPLQQNAAILLGPLSSGSPQSGGSGVAPVVTAMNCTVSSGFTNGQTVNQVHGAGACGFSATCSGGACNGANVITSWAISAQSCSSCYSISSSGLLQGGSNAANVTNDSDTVTVIATNSTGTSPGVVQSITAYADGTVGAPSGTAQFPTLLTGLAGTYVTTPAWNVAGVNYYVGIDRTLYPTNANLKNPNTISIPGVTVTTHNVHIVANNVTLDGYDFSLGGGYSIEIGNGAPPGSGVQANNITISNSYFLQQTGASIPIFCDYNATNITIMNNLIDGNNGARDSTNIGTLLDFTQGFGGTVTIKYNWFRHAYSDVIDFGTAFQQGGFSETYITKYNLYENNALQPDLMGHPDLQQLGPSVYASITTDFNTVYNSSIPPATMGFGFSSSGGATINGGDASYNTFVTPSGANTLHVVETDTTELNGTITINKNYVDPNGITDGFYVNFNNGGAFSGTVTFSGNINMVTGAALP